MNDITHLPRRGIIRQQPQLMLQEQAKADAIIEYARKVKDWPLVEQAVDEKIEQQQEFVDWWNTKVHHKGGERWLDNTDRGYQYSLDDAEKLTGIKQQQKSRFDKELKHKARYRERQILRAFRGAHLEPAENHRAEGTGENEWFTPPEHVEAAREVLGTIDLDPATHPKAQEYIKATQYFTVDEDGLKQQWHGRIWLNPPYAQPDIVNFVQKLLDEIAASRTTAAILLTHSYTDTAWFHNAMSVANRICFTRGRIKFVDDVGDSCAPTQGQAFFYYGPQPARFRTMFKRFGKVVRPE
jgi:ParB family chromosome partitioning protein